LDEEKRRGGVWNVKGTSGAKVNIEVSKTALAGGGTGGRRKGTGMVLWPT